MSGKSGWGFTKRMNRNVVVGMISFLSWAAVGGRFSDLVFRIQFEFHTAGS